MPFSKIIYKASAQATPETWMDSTPATAAAADITAPKTAMLADGVLTTGTGSGGGSVTVEEKDVNFIDYDGSIVASYTAADFASLSALPANPSHAGLTAQGWNWSLSDAKTYVASYGKLWIGQMYVTDDGKTRIYIHIPDDTPVEKRDFSVRFTQTVSYGVSVDWGDGTTAETYSGTSATNHSHTYSDTGYYIITLDIISGKVSFVGTSSNAIYGVTNKYYNRNRIKKVEFGDNVTSIGNYAFYYCYALKNITVPRSITSFGDNTFYYCYLLHSITVPYGITSIGSSTFNSCYDLALISLPLTITSIGNYAFQYCYDLSSITIPSGVLSIGSSAFNSSFALSYIIIPYGVTSIGGSAFATCSAITSVDIPSSVSTIGASAFSTMYSANIYRARPTSPPTIGTNAFANITAGAIIYVPYSADHSILDAYKTATNWSTYASYMQEEPQ